MCRFGGKTIPPDRFHFPPALSGRGHVVAKKKLSAIRRLLNVGAPKFRSFVSSWNARSSSGVAVSGEWPRAEILKPGSPNAA